MTLEADSPRRADRPEVCRNCGAPVAGSYCSACGQKAAEDASTTLSIFREWLGDAFSTDSRVARTAISLLTRPGVLAREHRQGHRAAYLRPVQTYSILSASFFAIFLFTRPIDARYYHLPPADLSSYATSMGRIVLLLVPIVALTLRPLVHPRRLVAEHLVFAFYTGAAGFAGLIFLLICSTLWKWWWRSVFASPIDVVWLVYAPGWLALLVYVGVALKHAYGLTAWAALLDTVVVTVVTGAAFTAMTVAANRL